MSNLPKILPARFFCTTSGTEPVREWLRELITGYKDLWEVRSKLTGGRIARVIFYIRDGKMILLHGFIKKTQKTSPNDLDLAIKRKKEHERNG